LERLETNQIVGTVMMLMLMMVLVPFCYFCIDNIDSFFLLVACFD
jgi:hypothetical protein